MQKSKKLIYIPTIDENDLEENFLVELCERLDHKLKIMEKKTLTAPKIYFSGEYDSNQSDFEKASNNLEICVIAKNDNVAFTLLRMVRRIVEGTGVRILEDLEEFCGQNISIEKIIKILSHPERAYSIVFDIDQKIERTLRGWNTKTKKSEDECITKDLSEINIYTLPRVIKEFEF